MAFNATVSLDTLRTIHRIHRQLTDLRERSRRGPMQITAADANVKNREADVETIRAGLKTTRKSADQKQLELKTSEGKIKELKTKLNLASSNREYQILKEQIAADEMAKSVLEDEIIENLEQVDAFHPKIAEAEAALLATQQKAQQTRTEVAQRQPMVQADIERLEGELREAESQLPPDILELYQRTVRQRGEDAMAEMDGQYCGGCHQQVPLNIVAEIRMSHPSFCKTCGRLLYLPENFAPIRRSDD